MAIITAHTAPNFAFGDYFRILKAEFLCAPGGPTPRWVIHVGFYASAEARQAYLDPMFTHVVQLDLDLELPDGSKVEDPREALLYPLLMKSMFAGTNAKPHVEPYPEQ